MKKVVLSKIETTAPKKFSKDQTKKELQKIRFRLEELQNRLYAERKHAVLIVLQGMDASGKDGVIKNVFGSVNPLGCRVFPFKAPTEIELQHDFLWRVHQQVPEKGMIHIFNRSHYEDVLIQKVHHWVDQSTIERRYEHICNFEGLLMDAGTQVLKFYLHVSEEEQLQRLQERMTNPAKKWKHSETDFKEREYWNDYMKAYENVFKNCSDPVDWHIVPADQNWYKEYVIARKVMEMLEGLNMKYPGIKKEH
jgi:PPK2 family polyphosphate:nucleotide phosphotransferase